MGPPTAGRWSTRSTRASCSGIVYAIPRMKYVNILRMYETNVRSGEQSQPTDSRLVLEPDELLIASGRHIVKAMHRE